MCIIFMELLGNLGITFHQGLLEHMEGSRQELWVLWRAAGTAGTAWKFHAGSKVFRCEQLY